MQGGTPIHTPLARSVGEQASARPSPPTFEEWQSLAQELEHHFGGLTLIGGTVTHFHGGRRAKPAWDYHASGGVGVPWLLDGQFYRDFFRGGIKALPWEPADLHSERFLPADVLQAVAQGVLEAGQNQALAHVNQFLQNEEEPPSPDLRRILDLSIELCSLRVAGIQDSPSQRDYLMELYASSGRDALLPLTPQESALEYALWIRPAELRVLVAIGDRIAVGTDISKLLERGRKVFEKSGRRFKDGAAFSRFVHEVGPLFYSYLLGPLSRDGREISTLFLPLPEGLVLGLYLDLIDASFTPGALQEWIKDRGPYKRLVECNVRAIEAAERPWAELSEATIAERSRSLSEALQSRGSQLEIKPPRLPHSEGEWLNAAADLPDDFFAIFRSHLASLQCSDKEFKSCMELLAHAHPLRCLGAAYAKTLFDRGRAGLLSFLDLTLTALARDCKVIIVEGGSVHPIDWSGLKQGPVPDWCHTVLETAVSVTSHENVKCLLASLNALGMPLRYEVHVMGGSAALQVVYSEKGAKEDLDLDRLTSGRTEEQKNTYREVWRGFSSILSSLTEQRRGDKKLRVVCRSNAPETELQLQPPGRTIYLWPDVPSDGKAQQHLALICHI